MEAEIGPITQEEIREGFANQILSRVSREVLENFIRHNISSQQVIDELARYNSFTRSLQRIYDL